MAGRGNIHEFVIPDEANNLFAGAGAIAIEERFFASLRMTKQTFFRRLPVMQALSEAG